MPNGSEATGTSRANKAVSSGLAHPVTPGRTAKPKGYNQAKERKKFHNRLNAAGMTGDSKRAEDASVKRALNPKKVKGKGARYS